MPTLAELLQPDEAVINTDYMEQLIEHAMRKAIEHGGKIAPEDVQHEAKVSAVKWKRRSSGS
jgi:hypothetical protein